MIEIPVIETERLRLTALDERHFEAYASMLADPSSTRFVGDGEPLDRMNAWRSMAMLLGHWQLRGYGMWAIELKDSGEFVGRVGLHRPEGWPDLELGWMLKPSQRRPRLRDRRRARRTRFRIPRRSMRRAWSA